MTRPRVLLSTAVAALALTLASSAWRSDASVTYSDIMGCEAACTVAAAGWPFAYVVDYPGLSPAGSASVLGALLGIDQWRPGALFASFACWWLAVGAPVFALRRRR